MVGAAAVGGSLALAELIDDHGSALVADFQAHYGLRLADVLFKWSPREVFALVEGLPDDGLLAAHQQGGEKWRELLGWGKQRHMEADFYDLYVAAHTPKGKKAFTYPRPASKKAGQGTPLMAIAPRRIKQPDEGDT